MDEYVKVITRLCGILAQQTCRIRLGNRFFEHLCFKNILAANVDIGRTGAHRKTSDQRAFNQLMRVMTDDLAILAATRLGFIGVDDEEIGPLGRWCLGHEAPFHSRRETRTTASAQARRLHFLNNRILPDLHEVRRFVPVTTRLRRFQGKVLIAVKVGEDAVFVIQHCEEPQLKRV